MPFLRTIEAATDLFDLGDEDFSSLNRISLKAAMRESKEEGSPITEGRQNSFKSIYRYKSVLISSSPNWTATSMKNPVTHQSNGS